jgi:hypothetical protein
MKTILSMYLRNVNHKLFLSEICPLPVNSLLLRTIHSYNATYYYYICNGIVYRSHRSNVIDIDFTFIMEYV